jgi:hypothetical protein
MCLANLPAVGRLFSTVGLNFPTDIQIDAFKLRMKFDMPKLSPSQMYTLPPIPETGKLKQFISPPTHFLYKAVGKTYNPEIIMLRLPYWVDFDTAETKNRIRIVEQDFSKWNPILLEGVGSNSVHTSDSMEFHVLFKSSSQAEPLREDLITFHATSQKWLTVGFV